MHRYVVLILLNIQDEEKREEKGGWRRHESIPAPSPTADFGIKII